MDSRADCNVMSYTMWETLGRPKLQPSSLTFKSFSESLTSSLGKICLKAQIQEQEIYINFHVGNKDQAAMNIVLG